MSRRDLILERLGKVIEELSGLEPEEIDPELSFLELGFDSLFLTQAALGFQREFGVKVTFRPGERVRIVDGPFNDFRGTVAEIDMERTKVRVMVNFFGRETPVELDFLQVEKA